MNSVMRKGMLGILRLMDLEIARISIASTTYLSIYNMNK